MKKKFYITTAIDYVNAKPHIGHAFEKVLTDTIARWHRNKGENVFFLTGVDENAQKNVQAAEEAGMPTKKFIDDNTKSFIELCKKLNISYDEFIRTTAKTHKIVVTEIVNKIIKKQDIYKGNYEGYYCTGCESFKTEKELINGKCPEHDKKLEHRKEEAYFFKLSKYQDKLLKFAEEYITPKEKKNEIVSRLKEGLHDLCVSRAGVEWGIDFPNDDKFKIYVWVDALINYISGAKEKWPADVHVVGKGINWFHSVIWPALLMSAEFELPKKLLVHGYLKLDGEKMSKSLGNVIDPIQLAEKYGSDSVRYALTRCSVFEDTDFSEKILIERHNNELANKLGNLISRTSTLAEKYGIEKTKNSLLKKLNLEQIEKNFKEFRIDKALSEIFAFIDICNEFIQSQKPWETHDKKILYQLVESIREIAKLLSPFIPETAEKIQKIFKTNKIKKAPILFKKIEVAKLNKKEIPNKTMENVTTINFEDFTKLDLRVAQIENAENIEGADKLYKISLDVGELGKRTICAGIKEFYKIDDLKNKKIVIVANLAPRKLRGIESCGMLLAASSPDKKTLSLISPDQEIAPGSTVS